MPSECRGCDYYEMTKKRRPCKAGKGCIVRQTKGIARVPISISRPPEKRERKRVVKKWHRAAAKLYNDGKNDGEIARELGLSVNTVHSWRNRTGCPAVAKGGRPKGEAGASAGGV